jgi:hypothetical protein
LKVEGVKMKKNEKNAFCNLKNVFFLLLFLGWLFGFAFQRRFGELEKLLL